MDVINKDLNESVNSTRHDSGIFCEICLEFSGERNDVYGYCTDCKEYLCKICCEYHCQPKPSRDHRLVYKSDMPELNKNFKAQSVSGYVCPKMCEAHPDMPVLLYCEVHKKQICKLCASIIHKSCKTQDTLEKETRFLSNLKLERAFAALDEVQKTSNSNLATIKHFSKHNEQQLGEAMDGVQKLTTLLHSQIDSAMKEFVNKLKKLHKENKALIDSMSEMSKKAKIEATELKKHLQTFIDEQQYSQLYQAVQNSTEVTSILKARMKSIEICEKFKEFKCRVDKRLYDLIENPEVFILVKESSEEQMFPMYRQLVVPPETFPSEYVEGRIPDKGYEEIKLTKKSTGAYDYVYTFLSPQRKS